MKFPPYEEDSLPTKKKKRSRERETSQLSIYIYFYIYRIFTETDRPSNKKKGYILQYYNDWEEKMKLYLLINVILRKTNKGNKTL